MLQAFLRHFQHHHRHHGARGNWQRERNRGSGKTNERLKVYSFEERASHEEAVQRWEHVVEVALH
jgi:hypothetical protein